MLCVSFGKGSVVMLVDGVIGFGKIEVYFEVIVEVLRCDW